MIGRHLSRFFDTFISGSKSPIPLDQVAINREFFTLGSRKYPLEGSDSFGLSVTKNDRDCLTVTACGRSFICGRVRQWWNDPAKPEYEFVCEMGDAVSFTREIGRFAWPTPFEFDVLGGSSPRWKRHFYDRLRWMKATGKALEFTWRGELWFYRKTEWSDQFNDRLTNVTIK